MTSLPTSSTPDAPARRPVSQSQRAVSELRRMIVENELTPGSSHLEAELATLLGMSRTPICEACLILESNGLVQVQPRRGIRILPISPRDMEEIYSILTELEALAAHSVAERGVDEVDLARLRDLLDDMDQSLVDGDRRAWAEADHLFHSELARLSGNSRIQGIFATFADQVQRARMLTLEMRPSPTPSNQDHRAVVEAIARGDAEEARRVHREHRINAKHLIIDLLERAGIRSV